MKEYLTDAQVCDMLQISGVTLRRLLVDGPLRRAGAVDLRKAKPIWVGGQRRWDKSKVEALLGQTEQER